VEVMLGRVVEYHSPAHLSKHKAQEILADGAVHDKALTKKQQRFMQAVAHGMKPRRK